jgi:hypothetical protein
MMRPACLRTTDLLGLKILTDGKAAIADRAGPGEATREFWTLYHSIAVQYRDEPPDRPRRYL